MNHWKSLTFYRYVGSVMFLYNDEFYLRSTNAADPLRDRFIAATMSKRKDNSQWLILLDQGHSHSMPLVRSMVRSGKME